VPNRILVSHAREATPFRNSRLHPCSNPIPQANQLKSAHKASAGHKSISELRAEKSALEERVGKKQSEVAAQRSAGGDGEKPLTEKESQVAVETYAKMLRETKRRRGICYEMLAVVGEGNGESRWSCFEAPTRALGPAS
jgi:hypothetical protein